MIFHTPPKNQGQMVTYSYASAEDGMVIQRVHDSSIGRTSYYSSKALSNDDGEYWNQAPKNKRWKWLTALELRYILDQCGL